MREIYDRNGTRFHKGETDLENPWPNWMGPGYHWTAPVGVPFEILHDLEEELYQGGHIYPSTLPKGIYVALSKGDAYTCSRLERIGDRYTPESRALRDSYRARRAQRAV